jgi:hypothetical protein
VEQLVKLQQMPVSSSIFFVGCILVGGWSWFPATQFRRELLPFQHEGWDICWVTQKIIEIFLIPEIFPKKIEGVPINVPPPVFELRDLEPQTFLNSWKK